MLFQENHCVVCVYCSSPNLLVRTDSRTCTCLSRAARAAGRFISCLSFLTLRPNGQERIVISGFQWQHFFVREEEGEGEIRGEAEKTGSKQSRSCQTTAGSKEGAADPADGSPQVTAREEQGVAARSGRPVTQDPDHESGTSGSSAILSLPAANHLLRPAACRTTVIHCSLLVQRLKIAQIENERSQVIVKALLSKLP